MANGYTTVDAREYAQLEIDSIRQQEISIADFSEETVLPKNPVGAPIKICKKIISFLKPVKTKSCIPVNTSAIPSFIKIPDSKKKTAKLQDKWAGTLTSI